MHFGHPSAGGCQRSTGDPRLILGKGYRLIVLGGENRRGPHSSITVVAAAAVAVAASVAVRQCSPVGTGRRNVARLSAAALTAAAAQALQQQRNASGSSSSAMGRSCAAAATAAAAQGSAVGRAQRSSACGSNGSGAAAHRQFAGRASSARAADAVSKQGAQRARAARARQRVQQAERVAARHRHQKRRAVGNRTHRERRRTSSCLAEHIAPVRRDPQRMLQDGRRPRGNSRRCRRPATTRRRVVFRANGDDRRLPRRQHEPRLKGHLRRGRWAECRSARRHDPRARRPFPHSLYPALRPLPLSPGRLPPNRASLPSSLPPFLSSPASPCLSIRFLPPTLPLQLQRVCVASRNEAGVCMCQKTLSHTSVPS
ncbi:unnamed protein product [Closterium sp. NIES-54]